MVRLAAQGGVMQDPAPPGAWLGWLNEELTSVARGPLDFASCFCFGLSIGRRDHIDQGCLDVGLVGSIEEAFVETI